MTLMPTPEIEPEWVVRLRNDIAAYAVAVRDHDWSAGFSDDYSVTERADIRFQWLKKVAATSRNHTRVWELGLGHERRFTWEAEETLSDGDIESRLRVPGSLLSTKTRVAVHEAAWRWVGAFLWVHGVRVDEDEAKAFVGAVNGHKDWYGKRISTARDVDWDSINTVVSRFGEGAAC